MNNVNQEEYRGLNYNEHSVKCQLRIDYKKECGIDDHWFCGCRCHD